MESELKNTENELKKPESEVKNSGKVVKNDFPFLLYVIAGFIVVLTLIMVLVIL